MHLGRVAVCTLVGLRFAPWSGCGLHLGRVAVCTLVGLRFAPWSGCGLHLGRVAVCTLVGLRPSSWWVGPALSRTTFCRRGLPSLRLAIFLPPLAGFRHWARAFRPACVVSSPSPACCCRVWLSSAATHCVPPTRTVFLAARLVLTVEPAFPCHARPSPPLRTEFRPTRGLSRRRAWPPSPRLALARRYVGVLRCHTRPLSPPRMVLHRNGRPSSTGTHRFHHRARSAHCHLPLSSPWVGCSAFREHVRLSVSHNRRFGITTGSL
ncbi:hypothetical protein J3R03_008458 [Actinoplanes couchii]|nr:hypothetical protein [Actinoplanes couchii]